MKRLILLISALLVSIGTMAAEKAPQATQAQAAALPYSTVYVPATGYQTTSVALKGTFIRDEIVSVSYPAALSTFSFYGTGNLYYVTSNNPGTGYIVMNVYTTAGTEQILFQGSYNYIVEP